MFFVPDFSPQNPFLNEEESHHAIKVLRAKLGDDCQITDGKGSFYEGKIEKIDKKTCQIQIITSNYQKPSDVPLHIAIAPTKNIDRIEWLVEKCVELGIQKISFLKCQYSERKQINLERLQKIAVAALKQSKQFYLPILNEMKDFLVFLKDEKELNLYSQKFIAHLEQDTQDLQNKLQKQKSTLFLIGAEGDFSLKEITLAKEKKFESVSLGQTRLRTETAGLYVALAYKWINNI